MVPAKDFATSRRFYEELGFRPEVLADRVVEMHLGEYSFVLQDHYVEQWAGNAVFHMRVSDANLWWNRIVSLKIGRTLRCKSERAPAGKLWDGWRYYRSIWRALENCRASSDQFRDASDRLTVCRAGPTAP